MRVNLLERGLVVGKARHFARDEASCLPTHHLPMHQTVPENTKRRTASEYEQISVCQRVVWLSIAQVIL